MSTIEFKYTRHSQKTTIEEKAILGSNAIFACIKHQVNGRLVAEKIYSVDYELSNCEEVPGHGIERIYMPSCSEY